ncbi:pilin [Luteibacter aegosomatis]|nr:pilin [Luteibacter aegosomatis]
MTESLQAKGKYPSGNQEAGYTPASSTYVSGVTIAANGTGVVTITYRNIDPAAVDGKSITLTPTTRSEAQVFQWDCAVGAGGIDKQYVPTPCRH